MGEEYDDIVSSVPKYRAEILALTKTATSSGVDILDETGQDYRSIYDILVDIQKVWNEISGVDQAALLELLAGKQNSSIIAGLLNSSALTDAYEVASSAMGTLQKDNETYISSIQAKLNQLQASFQSLSTHILDSDLVKNIVDLGTKIIDVLDAITQKAGSLTTIVGGYSLIKSLGGPKMTGFHSCVQQRSNAMPSNTLMVTWNEQRRKVA